MPRYSSSAFMPGFLAQNRMNIAKFLERGKTFVHQAGASLLSRIGPEIINRLAGESRVEHVAELKRPEDAVSRFYQRMVAAERSDVVLVSTDSPDLQSVLRHMPKGIARLLYGASPITYAASAALGRPFDYRGTGHSNIDAFAIPVQHPVAGKVALVSGEEALERSLQATAGGLKYGVDGGLTNLYMSSSDTMTYIVAHELYHAVAREQQHLHVGSHLSLGEQAYAMALDETLSDLYAILVYASLDGTLENGLACVRGFRANHLGDISHDTLGMIDYILANHDLTPAFNLSPQELVGFVDQLRDELDALNNPALKASYAISVAERGVLSNRCETGERFEVPGYARAVAFNLGVDLSTIRPDRRAQEILDDLVTYHAYSRTFQREILKDQDIDPQAAFGRMARWLGVELPDAQRARIAQFNPWEDNAERAPVHEADRQLFERDRYALLKARYGEAPEQSASPAPWVITSASVIGGAGADWHPKSEQPGEKAPAISREPACESAPQDHTFDSLFLR